MCKGLRPGSIAPLNFEGARENGPRIIRRLGPARNPDGLGPEELKLGKRARSPEDRDDQEKQKAARTLNLSPRGR